MTAPVIAQNAKLPFEGLGLAIPHVQIGSERVAEDQPGLFVVAFIDTVVQTMMRQFQIRHSRDFLGRWEAQATGLPGLIVRPVRVGDRPVGCSARHRPAWRAWKRPPESRTA